jgi:uncharacterized protein YjbJ (UPF0337 family)
MNKDVFEGMWKQMHGEVRNWWGKLTDDDVARVGGNYEKLVGTIQERYGYSREQAMKEIDQRFSSLEDKVRPTDPMTHNK